MPWQVYSERGKYCVHKKNADDSKGELVACHDTEEKAQSQMRALYAAEGRGEMKEIGETTQDTPCEDCLEKSMYGASPIVATNFDELDAAREAEESALHMNECTADLNSILYNILSTPDAVMSGAEKMSMLDVALNDYKERVASYVSGEDSEMEDEDEEGEYDKEVWTAAYINNLPDSAFLLVESGGSKDAEGKTVPRSLRHLPVRGSNGAPDAAHIRNAIARAPQIKLRSGQKISTATARRLQARAQRMLKNIKKETSGLSQIVEAVRETVEKVFHKPEQTSPREDGECMVWKELDGSYGFLAVYSNNIQDREDEIISSNSHKRFVDIVDKGFTPKPDLQIWHIKEWTIGKATAVAYDESGFAIAVGTIPSEWSEVAEWLIEHQKELAMSHGMPASTVKYDEEDPGVIVEHITSEISVLPKWAAANQRTSFAIIDNEIDFSKEDTMPIPTQKREELLKMGLDAAVLAKVEQRNTQTAKEAELDGIKSKEETPIETPAPAVETTPAPVVEPTAAPAPAVDLSSYPTRDEVAEGVATVISPIISEMKEAIASLQNQIKEMTENQEQHVKDIMKQSTRDSLASMITSRFAGASTSKETVVNQGDPILRMRPKETPTPNKNKTGIPFIDQMLTGDGAKE